MAYTLTVNGSPHTVDTEPSTPLLWVLREQLGLTGTKYGCGIEVCGACTVMIDGQREHSCVYDVSSAAGKKIVTIEGLSPDRSHLCLMQNCAALTAISMRVAMRCS